MGEREGEREGGGGEGEGEKENIMANYDNIIVCMLLHLLLTLGACARALQYSVCLSVCYHSTACVRYL